MNSIFSGPCLSYPLLGRFCGVKKPTYYQDAGKYVLIVFTTDINVQFKGFNISYVLGDGKIYVWYYSKIIKLL